MNPTDKRILELKEKIAAKRKEIASVPKFEARTNFSLSVFDKRYNLNVIDCDTLLFLSCWLKSIQLHSEQDIMLSGYSIIDWCHDLDSKYQLLNIRKEKERLTTLEKALEEELSKDIRTDMKLKDIENMI